MRNMLIAFSLLVVVIMISGAGYFAGIMGAKYDYKQREQRILDSLSIINNIQSEKFQRESDSLKNFYSGIDKANEKTNNSIKKLLKQNEKKKSDLLIIGDSVKLHIIDSLLRTAGYR